MLTVTNMSYTVFCRLVLVTRKCSVSGLHVLIEILVDMSRTLTLTLPANWCVYIYIDVKIIHDAY